MITKDDDFEVRATEVIFNNGDESLLSDGEVYQLYDMVTEYIEEHYGKIEEDYHFTSSSLPQTEKVLH